jgi:cation diffusion facilitator family transporter
VREIITPHHAPAWFTLLVLALVILTKETLYRFVFKVGAELASTAVKGDAWHHRSDALTSTAAFIGISIALSGGKGYEHADDWAALFACVVILFNGLRIFRAALDEIMDAAQPNTVLREIRSLAASIPGVLRIEKCHARKSGLGLFVEIHVEGDEDISVRRGHEIAHDVTDHLKASPLSIQHVVGTSNPPSSTPPPRLLDIVGSPAMALAISSFLGRPGLRRKPVR